MENGSVLSEEGASKPVASMEFPEDLIVARLQGVPGRKDLAHTHRRVAMLKIPLWKPSQDGSVVPLPDYRPLPVLAFDRSQDTDVLRIVWRE